MEGGSCTEGWTGALNTSYGPCSWGSRDGTYQHGANTLCKVTGASVSPWAGTQHLPTLSGKKGKILWEWTQTHPKSNWRKRASAANVKTRFSQRSPLCIQLGQVLFCHQPRIWDRSTERDGKWEIFQVLAAVRGSAEPDVQGCHVPGNQAVVHWGLGWDRRPIQVQIAARTAHFGKSEGRVAIQQA